MEFNIPSPLKGEHEALHEGVARATKVVGNIGDAARAVAQILHPHFVKEEEYALPPLGLLPRLATEGLPDTLSTLNYLVIEQKAPIGGDHLLWNRRRARRKGESRP